MFRAYILLNTEVGSESSVLEALKVEGIEDAHRLWGVYNIILSVKADSIDALKMILNSKIKKIAKIDSKLTLISTQIENEPQHSPAASLSSLPQVIAQ
jgi:DNA-binding Lrp family transcriptional regulator